MPKGNKQTVFSKPAPPAPTSYKKGDKRGGPTLRRKNVSRRQTIFRALNYASGQDI